MAEATCRRHRFLASIIPRCGACRPILAARAEELNRHSPDCQRFPRAGSRLDRIRQRQIAVATSPLPRKETALRRSLTLRAARIWGCERIFAERPGGAHSGPRGAVRHGTKGDVPRFPIGRCEGTLSSAPFRRLAELVGFGNRGMRDCATPNSTRPSPERTIPVVEGWEERTRCRDAVRPQRHRLLHQS
jgi:hypothetical protein